jgi:hypothetical protein
MLPPCVLAAAFAAALFCCTTAAVSSSSSALPRMIGQFPLTSPGFLRYSPEADTMLVTTFGALGSGGLYLFNNFSATWNTDISAAQPSNTASGLVWPNVPTNVPSSMFNTDVENFLLIGDGFLVPGKQTGNVVAVTTNSLNTWTYLAPPDADFFYHKAVPFDVDNDGDLDIVTCRATLPFLAKGHGELLWLENNGSGLESTWPAHVLQSGPDIIFDIHPWSTPANLTIASGEFFNARVTLTVVNFGTVVKYDVIDDTIGAIDDVGFHNLDGTGVPNLLVTNHVSVESLSGVFAYTWNQASSNWTRTILSQGFKTRAWFQGMSPGFVYPLYPQPANPSGFPTIAIAGDGTYELYLLLPTSKPLVYTRQTLLVANGTVAALEVGDFNGDGWTDMLVPNYDLSQMYAFTFKPSSL